MKEKVKQALISYFIDDYNGRMGREYKVSSVSQEQFHQIMSKAESVTICYQSYCCYGMYHMCWIDEYANSIWNMTEEEVRDMTISVFEEHIDDFNQQGRVAFCEDESGIHILFIARDLKKHKMDTFIDLWKGDVKQKN